MCDQGRSMLDQCRKTLNDFAAELQRAETKHAYFREADMGRYLRATRTSFTYSLVIWESGQVVIMTKSWSWAFA